MCNREQWPLRIQNKQIGSGLVMMLKILMFHKVEKDMNHAGIESLMTERSALCLYLPFLSNNKIGRWKTAEK